MNLGADGNLWVMEPDDAAPDVVVTIPGVRHFNAWPGVQKYHSYFEVFVDQPWPNYPNNNFDNDPESPTYNPETPGYPYFRLGDNAGHAWWKLSTDAPVEAINQFAKKYASQWNNTEVGYGPSPDLSVGDWLLAIDVGTFHPYEIGELPYPNNHTATTNKTYAISFIAPGLVGELDLTEYVHENPGYYTLLSCTCVTKTSDVGRAAGVTLPSDSTPEMFGFHLPPNNP
jgi:hypothetical protein